MSSGLAFFLAFCVLVNTQPPPPPGPPPGPPPPTAAPPPAPAPAPPSGGNPVNPSPNCGSQQPPADGGMPDFGHPSPMPCGAPRPPITNSIPMESADADTKLRYLWGMVSQCPYNSPYPTNLTGAPVVNQLVNITFDEGSFLIMGDELQPPLRPKLLHTYGTTGLMTMEIFCNSTYTGVFKAGTINQGLIRFSLGSIASQSTAFGPSIAIKILQDNKPSVNILAMDNPDGQGTNRNFFLKSFSNFRPAPVVPANVEFLKIFHAAVLALPGGTCKQPLDENRLPLFTAARAGVPPGNTISDPTVLHFIPMLSIPETSQNDFRVDLERVLRPGITLYLVAARDTETSADKIIGKVIMRSNVVTTPYQDTKLFFQHARIQRCGAGQ